MKVHAITKIKNEIPRLVISVSVTEEQAMESMRILENFNQCMVGITNFSGLTPWECHQDDEFLQVIEGRVDIRILSADGKITKNLEAGECFVMPKDLWHRQFSQDGAKVLFITSLEGNKTSTDEVPAQ